VLTSVKVYSSWRSAPLMPLVSGGTPDTDLIQIRNIDGLDPVKATINTSQYGSIAGADYVGGSVPPRNIVVTLHPNPDWKDWTHESLRRLLYAYFMPDRPIRLEFFSDDVVPVMIEGHVEGIETNIFSRDPELIISIICPDPYFTALSPVVLTGNTIRPGGTEEEILYNGNIETGIRLKVDAVTAPNPSYITVKIGDVAASNLTVSATVDDFKYLDLSSVQMQKHVQNVSLTDGSITSLLSYVQAGFVWPTLQPDENFFSVITDAGVQEWELTYYERFGGL
jgi:hypothetical protein